MSATDDLARLIAAGLPSNGERRKHVEATEEAIRGLFGERYHSRHWTPGLRRIALMGSEDNVPFAGFLHPNNPSSGVYGGMSLVWFPVEGDSERPPSSLLTFVCGTRGLDPDEQIMGRPGHARYLRALRQFLSSAYGVSAWVKHDPTNLAQPVPDLFRSTYPHFARVFERYGRYIYAAVEITRVSSRAREATAAFLDLYAWERGWAPLKTAKPEFDGLRSSLSGHLFPRVDLESLYALLRERRFVILQGPPGTGKTYSTELLKPKFNGRARTVQFHPAITYENFVAGISPSVEQRTLAFEVRPGWLVQAIRQAEREDYLLVIDEINRADLGRVLGEAIYLFEARDLNEGKPRTVTLPYPVNDGDPNLSIPDRLFVIGTMNSADRSVAILDLAVRRRFAFVDIWPEVEVVERQGLPLATEAFVRLQEIFVQYAPDDALVLLPGHAYFLARSEAELSNRLRFELVPLLTEYLQEGRLGTCESELRAFIDWLTGRLVHNAQSSAT